MQDDTTTLAEARSRGQVIDLIPVDRIDEGHLIRDRLIQDEDELQALMDSIRATGQHMPIEVVPLSPAKDGRDYGLISGWRRLTALKRLFLDTDDARFAVARALVVRPETAQDAYVAMVEENEIRVDLSHYERARIALAAVHEGVFPDQRAALRGLYGSTTKSKRSKIGTFMGLVQAFDDVLSFPTAISEKLGLAMAREMVRDPRFAARLRETLVHRDRASAAAEVALLVDSLTPPEADAPVRPDAPARKPGSSRAVDLPVPDGLTLRFHPDRQRIDLKGEKVTEDLAREIAAFLAARG